MTWRTLEEQAVSRKNVQELIDNTIPLIRIPNFASSEECSQLEHGADRLGFDCYKDVKPRIDRIGVTVFEHPENIPEYFSQVDEVSTLVDAIYEESFDPVSRLMEFIKLETGIEMEKAKHEDYGDYYAGTIRKMPSGTLLHIDYAPCEEPDWDIGNVMAQLAWNLYVQHTTPNEGKLRIYDRAWRPEDQQYKGSSYGYADEVVEGVQFVDIYPKRGDLYIFNTQNYHIVDPSSGVRMTVNSQIGVHNDGKFLLWS